jgi:type I restriction enzyme S subunit
MSLPRYPEYKGSGTPWLGELPEHWKTKPVWTLFRRTKRIGFESEQLLSVYRDHGVIPKASRDDNNNKASDDLSVYQLVKPGDLAINKMKAWQGSVAISEHQGC